MNFQIKNISIRNLLLVLFMPLIVFSIGRNIVQIFEIDQINKSLIELEDKEQELSIVASLLDNHEEMGELTSWYVITQNPTLLTDYERFKEDFFVLIDQSIEEEDEIDDAEELTKIKEEAIEIRNLESEIIQKAKNGENLISLINRQYVPLQESLAKKIRQKRIEEETEEFLPALEKTAEQLNIINMSVLLSAFLEIILLLITTWIISELTAKPLAKLVQVFNEMALGNLKTPIKVDAYFELNALSKSANKMRSQLKKSLEDLEAKVDEQTKRLNKQVSRLQKFKELTVDTEIHSENVRKENEKLKKEIGRK